VFTDELLQQLPLCVLFSLTHEGHRKRHKFDPLSLLLRDAFCSKCGTHIVAPLVRDYRTHVNRPSTRLRECPTCKQRWQQQQQQTQAGGGSEGGSVPASSSAGSSGMHKTHHEYQMHRDLNAAWNLINVCKAAVGSGCSVPYLHHQSAS